MHSVNCWPSTGQSSSPLDVRGQDFDMLEEMAEVHKLLRLEYRNPVTPDRSEPTQIPAIAKDFDFPVPQRVPPPAWTVGNLAAAGRRSHRKTRRQNPADRRLDPPFHTRPRRRRPNPNLKPDSSPTSKTSCSSVLDLQT